MNRGNERSSQLVVPFVPANEADAAAGRMQTFYIGDSSDEADCDDEEEDAATEQAVAEGVEAVAEGVAKGYEPLCFISLNPSIYYFET